MFFQSEGMPETLRPLLGRCIYDDNPGVSLPPSLRYGGQVANPRLLSGKPSACTRPSTLDSRL